MNTNPILNQKRVWRFLGALPIALFTLSTQAQTTPTITRQPVSGSHSLGATAIFTVSATGSLTYQWQHNDVDLSGAINRTLTLTNLSLSQAGTYRVMVSNAAGTTISDPAELDVDATFTKITAGDYVRASETGVAWGDYDGDGFLDLYSGGSTVYHNNPNRPGTFTRVAITSGINTTDGAFGIWADYDNDGDLDLFVPLGSDGVSQPNQLLRNEGNGRFQRITTGTFLTDRGPTSSAAWGDYDRDGFLDLFCANYAPGTLTASYLYHNNGDGTFTRVQDWELATYPSKAFACNWVDVNGDGWLDITVGTNPGGQVVYWENQQGQGFERFILPGGGGPYLLGPAWADFDNDGDLDAFVAYAGNPPGKLIRNNGDGNFEPLFDHELSTINQTHGVTWGDFDNDGWLDLYAARTTFFANLNGPVTTSSTNALWHNNGDGTFTQVLRGSPVNDPGDSVAAAWADIDNDGFLDLAVSQQSWTGGSEKNVLYRNNGNANAWLTFILIGTKSNRSAIGAKIRVTANIRGTPLTQLRAIGSDAVLAQNDPRPHFGLGDATVAEKVRIEWPSGQVQELTNVAARQFLTVTEPGLPPTLKAAIVAGALRLTLTGDANATYELQWAPDLAGWQSLAQVTANAEGWVTYETALDQPQRFYRAVKR